MFMQGLLGGRQSALVHGVFVMPCSKDSAMTFVDYRDVAEAAAIAFTTDDLVNGTFELAAGGMVTRTELALRTIPGRPPRPLNHFFAELAR